MPPSGHRGCRRPASHHGFRDAWQLVARRLLQKEQIENFFEFLTKEIGLDPERIYVTCFIGNEKYGIEKDTEAAEIWREVFQKAGVEAKVAEIGSAKVGDERGIKPGERIFFTTTKKTGGAVAAASKPLPLGDPCGPDSEVFYDFGEDKQDVENMANPTRFGRRPLHGNRQPSFHAI